VTDPAPIAELVDDFAQEHHCPSISWGIARHGSVVASGTSGSLSDGAAATTRTVYRIASMTKSLTAATVLALRDEGVLRLDDPITTFAPEFGGIVGPTTDAAPITLAHLLSMASGIATDDVWADRHLDISDADLDAIAAAGVHFAVPTDTAFEYSNLGFALIGRIVERASATRVQDHVTQRFLRPLGMHRTTWVQPDHDDWARPFRWEDDTHLLELPLVGDGTLAPMGGIWSCVDDLAVWANWFDEAFPARDDPDDGPLRRSSRREMQQMHRFGGSREIAGRVAPNGYGYGLLMRDDPTLGWLAGHSGGLPGYGSNMRWAPGRGLAVIALANVTYAHMAELTLRIFDALHEAGEVPSMAVPVTPVVDDLARRLVELLHPWDDARADELFTDNVAMDESYARRRAHATTAIGAVGPVTIASITALSAAGADVVLHDAAGGELTIEMEISPLLPPRIESWSIERNVPTEDPG